MSFLVTHIIAQLPTSFTEYVLQVLIGLIVAIVLGSFFEHAIHKSLMHRESPFFRKKRFFANLFRSHALLHHGKYYKQFDHEDDPVGREESIIFAPQEIIAIQLMLLPIFFLIALVSPVFGFCLLIVAFIHNNLWNIIHREMHQPKKPFWARWLAYRFLARYHFLHHRHTAKNYNVVFPFADYVFHTNAVATAEDIRLMELLGYKEKHYLKNIYEL